MPLFTSSGLGLGLGLKNLVLFTSLILICSDLNFDLLEPNLMHGMHRDVYGMHITVHIMVLTWCIVMF